MIEALTDKEKKRIKEGCEREYVNCYDGLCPYQEGKGCILSEGEECFRPNHKQWTGSHMLKDDSGNIYVATGKKVNAKFPTEEQTKIRQKEIRKNFMESW